MNSAVSTRKPPSSGSKPRPSRSNTRQGDANTPIGEVVLVGIDPGLSRCGWAVVTRQRQLVASGTVRLGSWTEVAELVCALIRQHGPDIVGVEDVSQACAAQSRLGHGSYRGTLIREVAACAYGVAVAAGVEAVMVTPAQWRGVLGVPCAAPKRQCARGVQAMLVAGRGPRPRGQDEHDATAIALAAGRRLRP